MLLNSSLDGVMALWPVGLVHSGDVIGHRYWYEGFGSTISEMAMGLALLDIGNFEGEGRGERGDGLLKLV